MAKKTTEQAPAASSEQPKRKMLTPAERVAKLEADLAAAKKRAEERANKGRNVAMEKRGKLVAKRDEINSKIAKIDEEFPPQDEAPEGDES